MAELNAQQLLRTRDRNIKELDEMSIHEVKGGILARLTALNVLCATACKDNLTLDEVDTLTEAGRIIDRHYER